MTKLKDSVGEQNLKQRQDLEEAIDNILDSEIDEHSEMHPEEYLTAPIDPYALTVFGGYVARKIRGMKPASSCKTCIDCLCMFDEPVLEREALLQLRNRGGMVRPTNALQALLGQLENAVMTVTSSVSLHSTVLFTVLDELLSSNISLQLIGCREHARRITSAIVSFYLTTRMHFACAKSDRKRIADKNRRKRDMAKSAKLGD
ncbi:hypothetical protein ONE63_003542 [Megalurothrips usitatus]|uniref:Uncharacterized protein n=1 Tax=Megalurothrips usitatus TaxID=439358 RepID=A0AAV7XA94_9NEOP|nr:hypothetical protein ONE63_003542 [Megalurothrips usitatus]